MNSILRAVVIVVLLSSTSLGYKNGMKENSTSLSEAQATLVPPLLNFTSNIYMKAKNDSKNLIFSPISIHKALNMVLVGAIPRSQTRTELLDTLCYRNHSVNSVKNAHQSYAKLLTNFKDITKSGLAALNVSKNEENSEWSGHMKKRPPIIRLWNSLIVNSKTKFKPNYIKKVKRFYRSRVMRIGNSDDEKRLMKQVDSWAKQSGFEGKLLDAKSLKLKKSEILILSAVHLKASWFSAFDEHQKKDIFFNHGLKDQLVKSGTVISKTKPRGFKYIEFTSKNKLKYRKFSNRTISRKQSSLYNQLTGLNFELIELRLQGNVKLSIFEPLNQGADELKKLVDQLMAPNHSNTNQTKLSIALQVLDSSQQKKENIEYFEMPAFKFENKLNLIPILEAAGLKRVFDKNKSELSMIPTYKSFVTEANHQAVVEVNKFGVSAAAITKINFGVTAAPQAEEEISISIKNPFMFLVRHDKIPLFVGQLVEIPVDQKTREGNSDDYDYR